MDEIIKLVKLQQMWSTSAFDALIRMHIEACVQDLKVVGISNINIDASDSLVVSAILTWCRMRLGKLDSAEYDRLKRAYDEMKSQMQTSRAYGLKGSGR